MSGDPMDQAPNWRRLADDTEAAAALPAADLTDPVAVGIFFCQGLKDPTFWRNALHNLSTPSTYGAWDYQLAADYLASIPDYGFSMTADRAEGAPDVAYFKIFAGVSQSFQVLEDQDHMTPAAVLTLVWWPELGHWTVHAIGNPVPPEEARALVAAELSPANHQNGTNERAAVSRGDHADRRGSRAMATAGVNRRATRARKRTRH